MAGLLGSGGSMSQNDSGTRARQARNRQLETDAAEIRIRAERRIGELMAAQKESVGLNTGAKGVGNKVRVDEKPTLAEAGIDKKPFPEAQ